MKDRLVAHRGDMTQYIENTVPAIQAAIDLGMRWIEVDVQISKNLVPIVIHDNDLNRIIGFNGKVTELSDSALANYPIALTSARSQVAEISTLENVVTHLNNNSDITLFVEVKKESVNTLGLETVMESVALALERARFSVVIISFLKEVAEIARKELVLPIGWVVTEFNQDSYRLAKQLQPEFIFCNVKKIDELKALWPGNWRWVLYDIMDPAQARYWLQSPQVMIETGDIFKLMNSNLLD